MISKGHNLNCKAVDLVGVEFTYILYKKYDFLKICWQEKKIVEF
jgi:hypothetical protein